MLIAGREQRMLPTNTPEERQRARDALRAEITELERAIGVLDFIDESVENDARTAPGVS